MNILHKNINSKHFVPNYSKRLTCSNSDTVYLQVQQIFHIFTLDTKTIGSLEVSFSTLKEKKSNRKEESSLPKKNPIFQCEIWGGYIYLKISSKYLFQSILYSLETDIIRQWNNFMFWRRNNVTRLLYNRKSAWIFHSDIQFSMYSLNRNHSIILCGTNILYQNQP